MVQTYTAPTLISRASRDAISGPLVIASNRAPIEYYTDGEGRLRRRETAGGVARALTSIVKSMPVTWIASASTEADRAIALEGRSLMLGQGNSLRLIAPPPEAYHLFYNSFCNPLLWFLQHGIWDRLDRANVRQEALHSFEKGYLPVNQVLAKAVASELRAYDDCGSVMLHDYHLYAAPTFIRDLCPEAAIQHFVHIPWPHPEAWQELPRTVADSICEGLLSNDSLVFQTESSARDFLLTCCAHSPSAHVDFNAGTVTYRGRRTRVWANPISVDVFDLRTQVSSPKARPYYEMLRRETGEFTIVRVDRLDPSKNIEGGFRATDRLLQEHPEWLGRVRFLAFLIPSRTWIPEYDAYAKETFALVDEINVRHGTDDWEPIEVFYEHNRLQALVALTMYDVLLVNSFADGMNLVSKEGPVLNDNDGILVLSTGVGSHDELRDAVLAVRPEDEEGTADALHRALAMSPEERQRRAKLLRRLVLRHDIGRWLQLQLQDLASIENIKSPPAAP